MVTPVSVHQSAPVPAPLAAVFTVALSTPLPELYRRRFGPIPPVVAVHEQQGVWETPGQTRVLELADGGRMREEITSIDPPNRFANRLTVLSGPFASFVSTVDESWTFRSVGEQTVATWEWNLMPRSAVVRPLTALVGRLWLGYAGRVLDQLVREVAKQA